MLLLRFEVRSLCWVSAGSKTTFLFSCFYSDRLNKSCVYFFRRGLPFLFFIAHFLRRPANRKMRKRDISIHTCVALQTAEVASNIETRTETNQPPTSEHSTNVANQSELLKDSCAKVVRRPHGTVASGFPGTWRRFEFRQHLFFVRGRARGRKKGDPTACPPRLPVPDVTGPLDGTRPVSARSPSRPRRRNISACKKWGDTITYTMTFFSKLMI